MNFRREPIDPIFNTILGTQIIVIFYSLIKYTTHLIRMKQKLVTLLHVY